MTTRCNKTRWSLRVRPRTKIAQVRHKILPCSSDSYHVEQVSSRYRRNDWEVHERGLWACEPWSRMEQVVLILSVQKWAALLKLEGLKLKIQQREMALSTTGRRAVGSLTKGCGGYETDIRIQEECIAKKHTESY